MKEIATIRSGHLFREKIEPDPNGPYQVIQIGDITTDARLSASALTRISLPDIKPSQIIEKNDVLFISRGMRKQAVAITEPLEQTIATSQIFVIRPDERLLPEYLAWFINQRPAQHYLEEHSTGTNVSLVNMEALSKMPVQMPNLETQQRIVQVHNLSIREKELMDLIQARRRALIENSLLRTLEPSGSARRTKPMEVEG
ncbi:MAG TPA: restriction endonuclease subunit S [Blastocatellia bacterium]|nr:restriction endonuclease subunit S [Blastocatellia bacterium]